MEDFTFRDFLKWFAGLAISIVFITGTVFGIGYLSRNYNVWAMEMKGKASLMEATQTRQIQIEQAKAEKEAAQLRADAIAIVGKAAQDYPEYRTQEFIGAFAEALREGSISQIIYVPTETSIPLLETQRLNTNK